MWLLLIMLSLAGCRPANVNLSKPEDTVTVPDPEPEIAHDFTLKTSQNEDISLSDYAGKWVVVNFWATWCPPCVKEMPYLQRLSEERDVIVLGVNFQEEAADVTQFVTENQITFPILFGIDETMAIIYQVRSLPRTFIIDPDGAIALRIIGPIDEEGLDHWLDEIVEPSNQMQNAKK